MAEAAFQQADLNQDGNVSLDEFRQFLGAGSAGAGASYAAGASFGAADSSFESASSGAADFSGAYGASFAGDAGFAGGASSYESYSSSAGFSGDAAAGGAAFSSAAGGAQVSQYASDAQGLFIDSNPQIIRRAAVGGVQTYTQNIKVRFLQPPPLPPPGPLIIKEVRPPQPPAPPPLRVRQTAPPLPPPPPLVLREKPPLPPAPIASQTVIRRLPGLPVPPRSVIIERLPPLPPKPRDIVIERWVPYGPQGKRKVIVQRAAAAKAYTAPRNVIIQYEQSSVRVVRQFQRLGVVQANPAAYVQTYGAQLLDASALLSQARAAGVVEDISAPAVAASFGASSYGFESAGGASASFGASSSGWEGGAVAEDVSGGFGESSFESSSFSAGGAGGFSAGGAGGFSAGGGFDGASTLFAAADTNSSGGLDINEFRKLFGQNA